MTTLAQAHFAIQSNVWIADYQIGDCVAIFRHNGVREIHIRGLLVGQWSLTLGDIPTGGRLRSVTLHLKSSDDCYSAAVSFASEHKVPVRVVDDIGE